MPATSVTELLFEAKPRWSGTIGAGGVAASNTTTIPLSSAANLDNGDAYIFVINRVTSAGVKNELSEMETVIGELSGTNFVNCVRGQEGTAQAWEAGLVVEILFTASHWNKLIEWAESEHNADGTHSDITADSVTSGTIEATTSADLKTLAIDGGTAMTAVKDEDDMASNSATALATQQSIKAYVDTGTVTMTNKTLTSPVLQGDVSGWTVSTDTWTYASASTFTIAGVDRTAVYTKGTRLKFTQTTVKYAVVISSSFSTDTTVSIAVNTDYTIANAAITLPYYSYAASPQGYPGYFSWTPTLTNLTIGNGTITAEYAQFGTTANFYFNVTFGNTTSMGTNPIFTVPVTPKYTNSINGASICLDSGTANFFSHSINESVGTKENVYTYAIATSGAYSTYNLITSTAPFTWTTNDRLSVTGTYEIA